MQVKKFEATSMQEALRVIKKEMGSDAIILSVKEHKKSFGIMSKASVEVTAAVSRLDNKESSAEKKKEIEDCSFFSSEGFEPEEPLNAQSSSELSSDTLTGSSMKLNISSKSSFHDNKNFKSENFIRDMENKNRSMLKQITDLKEIVKQISYEKTIKEKENFWNTSDLTDELIDIYHQLVHSGIEKRLSRDLVKDLNSNLERQDKLNFNIITEKLALNIMKKVRTKNPLKDIHELKKPLIFALIGPTGVGKTTTAAKIASKAILSRGIKLALINLDQCKNEQLKIYAELMDTPFASVKDKGDLISAIEQFSILDMILIDTRGIGQKDQENLATMNKILSVVNDCKNILIISATTKDSDINDILNRFMLFELDSIIYSKLDETNVYGSIYNTYIRSAIPFSYFTLGQQVPEDIELASVERLADLILKL